MAHNDSHVCRVDPSPGAASARRHHRAFSPCPGQEIQLRKAHLPQVRSSCTGSLGSCHRQETLDAPWVACCPIVVFVIDSPAILVSSVQHGRFPVQSRPSQSPGYALVLVFGAPRGSASWCVSVCAASVASCSLQASTQWGGAGVTHACTPAPPTAARSRVVGRRSFARRRNCALSLPRFDLFVAMLCRGFAEALTAVGPLCAKP